MSNVVKRITVIIMVVVMCISTPGVANAATVTKYVRNGSSYNVLSLDVSMIGAKSEKVDTAGLKKTSYTSGSVVTSTTKNYTFSASASLSFEEKFLFASIMGEAGVALSYGVEVSAGTTINLDSSAPNGVYYAYLSVPHVRGTFKIQNCTLNYTGWSTKYLKTISYMPMIGCEYLEMKRVY